MRRSSAAAREPERPQSPDRRSRASKTTWWAASPAGAQAEPGRVRAQRIHRLPRLDLTAETANDVINLGMGVFSPLEGFIGPEDLRATIHDKRLASGIPWTIPIVLDISAEQPGYPGEPVGLWYDDRPLALLEVESRYPFDRNEYAKHVFSTEDPKHPGVAQVMRLNAMLVGGKISVVGALDTPFARYRLAPLDTRILFAAKGWRTVVGFQTRNVPHLGHEYVQKTALTFVDGLFINPVIGRKKPGDFTDNGILRTYDTLMRHYYLRERAVLATLHTEMRYAGPREAIYHAIVRKNFGCSHFIVGRDHAAVRPVLPALRGPGDTRRVPGSRHLPPFLHGILLLPALRECRQREDLPPRRGGAARLQRDAAPKATDGTPGARRSHPARGRRGHPRRRATIRVVGEVWAFSSLHRTRRRANWSSGSGVTASRPCVRSRPLRTGCSLEPRHALGGSHGHAQAREHRADSSQHAASVRSAPRVRAPQVIGRDVSPTA